MTGEDHDRPYAPLVYVSPGLRPVLADRFRREWLRASRTGAVIVSGPPIRVLMPADPNPFPRIRLWGRR